MTAMTAQPLQPARPALDDDTVGALQEAVGVLAAKWSVIVLARLASGTHRFNELLRQIDGVSRRMLSATLRQLERDGLVERHVYARVPARVEYELSPVGEELLRALAPLAGWGKENQQTLSAARALFDDRLRQWRAESQELQARTQATPRII
jgi:DNA-binding HxlR family transcriptional regulator